LDKVELLAKALQAEDRGLTMIFARTKRTAQRVSDDLTDRGFAAAAVHGDLGQGAREQALRAFRSEKVDVLVATDVAARGIDVTGVTHVVNYQCPEDSKTYIHRIGRTGRAGREGVAITLVDWDEITRWKMISDELGLELDEPVETYSTSDHLFADLGIPTEATGRLPRAQRIRAGLDAEQLDEDGPRGRRDRGRGAKRRGSSGGESGQRTEADDTDAPRASRAPRQRRRSRGGVLMSSAEAEAAAGEQNDELESGGSSADATHLDGLPELGSAEGTNGAGRRPRRRRRGGQGRSSSDGTPDAAAS
jgi:superfamily II DNA/RNA helicase